MDKYSRTMVDKFLTEAMGECWHEVKEGSVYYCLTCKGQHLDPVWRSNLNFSTWEAFGKLWEWAIKQEWWFDFIEKYLDLEGV